MKDLVFGVILFLIGFALFINWCFRKGFIGVYINLPTLSEKVKENVIFALWISGLLIALQALLTEFF